MVLLVVVVIVVWMYLVSGWWQGSSDIEPFRCGLNQTFTASVPSHMSHFITTNSVFAKAVSSWRVFLIRSSLLVL